MNWFKRWDIVFFDTYNDAVIDDWFGVDYIIGDCDYDYDWMIVYFDDDYIID